MPDRREELAEGLAGLLLSHDGNEITCLSKDSMREAVDAIQAKVEVRERAKDWQERALTQQDLALRATSALETVRELYATAVREEDPADPESEWDENDPEGHGAVLNCFRRADAAAHAALDHALPSKPSGPDLPPQKNAKDGLTTFGLYVSSLRWAVGYIDKLKPKRFQPKRFRSDERPSGAFDDDWMEWAAAHDLLKDALPSKDRRGNQRDFEYELHIEECDHGSTLMNLDRAKEALKLIAESAYGDDPLVCLEACQRIAAKELAALPSKGTGEKTIPDSYWRDVPCGHPPDPVAMYDAEGWPVCHCGHLLDTARLLPAPPDAPGPISHCQKCGCHVAIPPADCLPSKGEERDEDEVTFTLTRAEAHAVREWLGSTTIETFRALTAVDGSADAKLRAALPTTPKEER